MHCFFNIVNYYRKPLIFRFYGKPTAVFKLLIGMLMLVISIDIFARDQNKDLSFQQPNLQFADSLLSEAKKVFFSDLSNAELMANRALVIYQNEMHTNGIINSLNLIASAKMSTGDYNDAIEVFKNALEQAISINDQSGIGKVSNNLGNVYLKSGEYEKALEWFFKSLKIYEEIQDNNLLIAINNNIGLIYKNAGSSAKALDYYSKALKAAEEAGKPLEQGNIHYNYSSIYLQQDKYSNAKDYCQKSIELYKQAKNKLGQIRALTLLARIYYKFEQFDLANDNLQTALALATEQNVRDEQARIMQHLGYNEMKHGNLQSAKDWFLQSLTLSKEVNLDRLILDNYNYLSQTDSLLGNFKQALTYLHKAQLIEPKNTAFSVEEKLAELTQQYDFVRKENLYINQELQSKKITIALLFSMIGVLVLLSIVVIQQVRLRSQRKISLLTQQNLRSQMNPHFIFNVINSIQYYILKKDTESSASYLSNFANLLRITLENSQKNLISIKDEIDGLRLYLDLELKRLENKFEYEVIIDEEIDELMFKVPSLMIQPFIENSILHGIQKDNKKGKILVELKLDNNTIHCIIVDNGIGRKKADLLKSSEQKIRKSFGSSITNSRLQLLNKLYGKELGIRYTDLLDKEQNPSGTRVEFDLPVLN